VKFHIGGIVREPARADEVRFLNRQLQSGWEKINISPCAFCVRGLSSSRKEGKMNYTARQYSLKRLVLLAMFSALAYATMFVLRIKVSFLTFEPKDSVITIAAMSMGPLSGLVISLLVTFLEMVTVSDTGFYGWIMNFSAAAVFSTVASLFYRRIRTVWGALAGLASAVASMTVVMLLLNLVIIPLYAGVKVDTVIEMIPPLLLPFNLIKATLNSALVMVLYKPISTALKNTHMLPGTQDAVSSTYKLDRKGIAVLLAGIILIALCVVVLIFIMDGSILFFKK
jgi:riboflavin transporter FmnP